MALNAGDYTRGASLTATILLAAMTLSYFALSYFSLFTLRGVTITFPIVAFVFLAAQAINSYYEHDVLRKVMEDFDTVSDGPKKNPHLKVQITFLILRIAAAAFLVIAALFFPALILLGLTATLLVQVFSSYSIRRKFAIVVKKIGENVPIAVRLNKYNLNAIPQIIIYFIAFVACLFALPMVGFSELFSAAVQSKIALSVIGVTGACFLGLIALKVYDILIYSRPNASAPPPLERIGSEDSITPEGSVVGEQDEERKRLLQSDSSSIPPDRRVTAPLSSAPNSYVKVRHATGGSPELSKTPSPVLSAEHPSDTTSSSISEVSTSFQLPPQQQQLQPPPVHFVDPSATTVSSSISVASTLLSSGGASDFLGAKDNTVSNASRRPQDEENTDTDFSPD